MRKDNVKHVKGTGVETATQSTPNRIFSCGKCDIEFTRVKPLHFHRQHLCVAGCVCSVCGLDNFTEKRHFVSHLLAHDSDYPLRPLHDVNTDHMCNVCHATFNSHSQLLGHTESNCVECGPEPPEVWPCRVCDARFTCTKNLSDHVR